jgi:hypothetical protein
MAAYANQHRTHESIINGVLAQLLQERFGLPAVAETLHQGARPDIVARLPQGPVILEVEVAPARTVEADALSRLGMLIDAKRVQNVYAVRVPPQLRTEDQRWLRQRMMSARLEWQEWRIDGTSGPRQSTLLPGLAAAMARAAPPADNLEDVVELLDKGAREAGSLLYSSPGALTRVAQVFGATPGDEAANMAALVVINAMVFQERLASAEAAYHPVATARSDGVFSTGRLLRMWDEILDIDYYPIFSMARDVVRQLSEIEASGVLNRCAETAARLLGMGAVGRHDLAGRIFNQLVSERKLLAAYYTSIPSSTLLAGLALSPARWPDMDWGDAERLSGLRVVDPACGTGTLLMAAYRQILQNHREGAQAAPGSPTAYDPATLHRALVERVIMGADVVQAAIHLTAATLAAMSPTVRFARMELHTFRLGKDATGEIKIGSLDWLGSPETQATFSAAEEQVGAASGAGGFVQRPQVDLVISNPPYTRRGSDGGNEESIVRVFSLPEGDKESMDAIREKTSALLKGTPANLTAGHGSSFAVLADRMVNPGGRIAFVLPVTALAGESWSALRQMLSSRYELEFVVTSHDKEVRSVSYDTGIAEALLVARRLREGESPTGRGLFVNLWRAPRRETDALALLSAINSIASAPALRSDGPPVGGAPLMIGGEQWGEMADGPLGAPPWTTARWRRVLTGQFAAALERGELRTRDGSQIAGRIPMAALEDVCKVGPADRQIRGSLGKFDAYHGWDEQAQFPAIWSHSERYHQSMAAEPNAFLVPMQGQDHAPIWAQSGRLQVTPTIRYNSQRIMAACTDVRTLGVNSWFTLNAPGDDFVIKSKMETALALWCNSTFGLLLHVNRSNRTQEGRGIGRKGTLQSLPTLDARKLEEWQLGQAQAIWNDLSNRKFESFHQCAVDPARIELDRRVVRDLLGLGDDAVAAVANLRLLLANDPSIHGSKDPELPA